MSTFPSLQTSITNPENSQSRTMAFSDCAPGDLVFLSSAATTELCLVVESGTKRGGRAIISFGTSGPTYSELDFDEYVIRVDHAVTFVLDPSSRRMSSEKPHAGVIHSTERGTVLYVRNAHGQPETILPFDIATFALGRSGRGIEFTRWSIEIGDELGRRTILHETNLKG